MDNQVSAVGVESRITSVNNYVMKSFKCLPFEWLHETAGLSIASHARNLSHHLLCFIVNRARYTKPHSRKSLIKGRARFAIDRSLARTHSFWLRHRKRAKVIDDEEHAFGPRPVSSSEQRQEQIEPRLETSPSRRNRAEHGMEITGKTTFCFHPNI